MGSGEAGANTAALVHQEGTRAPGTDVDAKPHGHIVTGPDKVPDGKILTVSEEIRIDPKFRPVLDPEFVPASLWNRAYRDAVGRAGGDPLALALERSDGSVSVCRTAILPHEGAGARVNERYVEGLLSFCCGRRAGGG